jgi:hypothetical protein
VRLAPALAAALLSVFVLSPGSLQAAPSLMIGFDDDTLKWTWRPDGVVGAHRELGVTTTRITIPWHRGEVRPRRLTQIYLHRAALATRLGQRIVLAVYGRRSDSPGDATSRNQYCSFVRHALARIPAIHDVVIWNEANSPAFWQGGPARYEALLARCWDRVHSLRHPVNLISSTASRHYPLAFLRGVADAYRRSDRTRPIIDTFGHNPYPETSAEPPWAIHESSPTIGEGDYGRLIETLGEAFAFTAQPVPSEAQPSLWYLEDGFQTAVPGRLRHLYEGRENERFLVSAFDGDLDPSAPTQARQLREAILLAYCQPAVGAFFNFELIDERRLVGWQSGVMWTNGTRKPSFFAFRRIVDDVREQKVDCNRVAGA